MDNPWLCLNCLNCEDTWYFRPLHILILNAAVLSPPYTKTEDGFELTFQVNYLAQFYLVRQLSDLLVESQPARIVVVSSESHR